MAKINYDYYDNKDIYNDGDVEVKLLEIHHKKMKTINKTN